MNEAGARFFKYDPDGAKKLLAEAGFPNGFSNVKLHYPNIFGAGYNTIAELMVQMLTKIGVNLQLTVDDYQGVYVPRTRQGNYDGMAFIPYGTYFEPGEVLTGMYLTGGNRNNSVLSGLIQDAELENKIKAIESNLNENTRKQQILDIQNELAQKMYFVPTQAGAAPTVNAFHPYMNNVLEFKTLGGISNNSVYFWSSKT
jgi:peptide/nickel transport system substrate-binding protein